MFPKTLYRLSYQIFVRSFVRCPSVRTNSSPLVSAALRPKKSKSSKKESAYFSDTKVVRTIGGAGGDGCISFLQLWCNERAGPDGGDGGNGGHVIFQASSKIRNLNHVNSIIKGELGKKGSNKDCHGRNAEHTTIQVPVGTLIRKPSGSIVGDLDREGLMFVASRGGIGGKGNKFFATAKVNSPKICESAPLGEDNTYILELRTLADFGLIGFPNAGKSTLLNAITRARSKVAPYPFTTIRPNIGIVSYNDYTDITVADLPGLVPGAHKNVGLGIQFLKHVERCLVLILLLDASDPDIKNTYDGLIDELNYFSPKLVQMPQIIVANKIDKVSSAHISELRSQFDKPIVPISAKLGTNLEELLGHIHRHYHDQRKKEK